MDVKEIAPADLALHMAALRQSMGWQILLNYMAQEREKIIAEGKKARREEKTIKLWAVMDGFDRACMLAEKLENFGKRNAEEQEEIAE